MGIKPGIFITIRHYSLINVFKALVKDVHNNTITIKLPKECDKTVFSTGDPLVIAFLDGDNARIEGGSVTNYDKNQAILVFKIDVPDEGAKKRFHERYPVSLYADFRLEERYDNKKSFALVKDISEYGMCIYSPKFLSIGQKLNLDVYLVRDIMSLSAEIVRKAERGDNFEYGLGIRHRGATVFNHIKVFVKKAQEEHINKLSSD